MSDFIGKPVKVISFDIDGTLVDDRFSTIVWEEAIPRLYAVKANLDLKSSKRYVYSEYEKIGQKRLEWYDIRYWFQRFGLDEDWRDILKAYRDEIRLYAEVPSVLENLKKHYVLIVITNAAREFAEIQTKQIRSYFKYIFSASTDFQVLKDLTRPYQMACDRLEIDPEGLVHVGDNRKWDYLVPRRLGVKAFLLDRAKKRSGRHIVGDLREFCMRIGV